MNRTQASRRGFLKASGAALSVGVGASLPKCFTAAANAASVDDERILVVVQLSGGNDGLNTVIPYADEAYREARPTLAIDKASGLSIDESAAFHPSLRGMIDLLDAGQVTVVQGVGYENPSRSHFESMDIWHSCLRKDQPRIDGWLGRVLETFPEERGGDVAALHLGDKQQPFALTSQSVRVPTVKDLDQFRLHGPDPAALRQLLIGAGARPSRTAEPTDPLLDFLRSSSKNAITASRRISEAGAGYQTDVQYPSTPLGEQLRVVAQLIDADLKTRVYYVELDGFDTHAAQPDTHSILLRQWSDSVSAFVKDMDSHGHRDRVCVMTFSEFGRRVAENASDGTDHGAAGPMFLCGGGLRAGLAGEAPSLTDLVQGDLKHGIDFRRVYASVLKDWLRIDPDPILGVAVETLPIFAGQAIKAKAEKGKG